MRSRESVLEAIHRISLACLPTRVQPLTRLEEILAGTEAASSGLPLVFVKRDDETGSDLSGNKVRKLEFLLAEAIELQADIILTCGGIQSNHCRATAIAARRLAMDSLLFLRGEEPEDRDGNLFLDSFIGADVRFISPEQYADRSAVMAAEADRLRASGRRPYVIPEGGSNARGSLGYIAMLEELAAQSDQPWDHIVCAVGSGGTLAGLVLGVKILDLPTQVWGINVCDNAEYFQDRVLDIAGELSRSWSAWGISRTGRAPALAREEIHLLEGYVGPGYAQTYPEALDTIRWIARSEGLLLDPVYTGKAFHGMVQEARRGRFGSGERVLFVHTGGVFSLFAYRRELLG